MAYTCRQFLSFLITRITPNTRAMTMFLLTPLHTPARALKSSWLWFRLFSPPLRIHTTESFGWIERSLKPRILFASELSDLKDSSSSNSCWAQSRNLQFVHEQMLKIGYLPNPQAPSHWAISIAKRAWLLLLQLSLRSIFFADHLHRDVSYVNHVGFKAHKMMSNEELEPS